MTTNSNTEDNTTKTLVLAAVVFVAFTAAYFPALQILVQKWAASEEYGHAFLTLPIIIYMVWQKKRIFSENAISKSGIGLVMVILASIIYPFSLLTDVHTIIFLALYLAVLGALVYLTGTGALLKLSTPLILFLFLLPLPKQLLTQITFPLQLFVSTASELFIHMFSIPLFRQGNIMILPERSFEVVEACSGLRSVITLMTLSIILGYFYLQRISSKLILFTASIATAIFVNIVRVVAMILLFYYWDLDLSIGKYHTATGIIIFCLAFFLLFLLQNILKPWDTK